jgi:hypothetical protein
MSYDAWINVSSYHLRLSLKIGISDTIEVYQGKKGSVDWSRRQRYLYETDYDRGDIEPDKSFQQQDVESLTELQRELIGEFPLAERLSAYWRAGESNQVGCLKNRSITVYNQNVSQQLISDWNSRRVYKRSAIHH